MSLYNKYRPKSFNEVFGHENVTSSIEALLETKNSFILHGPSGTGKTTIARICADMLDCNGFDFFEIDAASNSGIDAMKSIASYQRSYPQYGKSKVFIIDECHRLSKQAWDSLLKDIEEPPEYSYWFFCTTDIKNVPKTIKTRCTEFELKPLPDSKISKLVKHVASQENYKIEDGIVEEIVINSDGSPRLALNNLEYVISLKSPTIEQIKDHFYTTEDELSGGYKIAQMLFKKAPLKELNNEIAKLKKSKNEKPEGTRLIVLNYFTSCILKGNVDSYNYVVLNIFSHPVIEQNGYSDILLKVAKVKANKNSNEK